MRVSDVAQWIAPRYALEGAVACAPLRSYTNDVYAIRSTSGLFVLKVYGRGWRTDSEIRYEIALIRHLAGNRSEVLPRNGLHRVIVGVIRHCHALERFAHTLMELRIFERR